MLEIEELTYAAIITIELPEMRHPATISLTLTPPDVVETAPGEYKALRDCTLSDLQAFANAIEEAVWEAHRHTQISTLVDEDVSAIRITLINDGGRALALSREQVLLHAIRVGSAIPAPDAQQPPEDTLPAAGEPTAGEPASESASEAAATEQTPAPTTIKSEPAGEPGAEAAALEQPEVTAEVVPDTEAAPPVAEPATAPRVKELRIAGLRRPAGHPTRAAADILINEPAMRDAQAHALSSMDREVAGMLIGPRPEKQPDGRYIVHISDIIIAHHTRMMGASVTYTPESWRYVTDKLQELYPNEEALIVGWYHTHPGFGIFLSGMDLFIHQNFFTQPWHVALVLDPRAARMGFFCWDRLHKEVLPYEFPWPQWAPHAW